MYKASSVLFKQPKTKNNPKMHFLLFFIKIAKDYLRESIQKQFNTFDTESV